MFVFIKFNSLFSFPNSLEFTFAFREFISFFLTFKIKCAIGQTGAHLGTFF